MKMQHEFRGQIDCIIAHCINLIFPQAIVYAPQLLKKKSTKIGNKIQIRHFVQHYI